MKRIFTIAAAVLMTVSIWAQSPEKMSYQAVVRNSDNDLVISQAVGMQISILQGSATGTAVYVETHTPTTNANGLVSIEIGEGNVESGVFADIDWSNGPFFIQTETDPAGGTAYTITGTSQLMSVPYALHATTATTADSIAGGEVDGSVTNEIQDLQLMNNYLTITNNDTATNIDLSPYSPLDSTAIANLGYVAGPDVAQTISRTGTTVTLSNGGGTFTDSVNTYTAGANITISANNEISATGSSNAFYLGQDTLGGIVYYIYLDSAGEQHGLILHGSFSIRESWQDPPVTARTGGDRSDDGAFNTALMTNSPLADTIATLGPEWYLPSIDELTLLYSNRFFASRGIRQNPAYEPIETSDHWSSTEQSQGLAFTFRFFSGNISIATKETTVHRARAIRSF